MHAVVMPDQSKNITIKLPPLKPWVKRGHIVHRGGSGVHGDRRTNRLRTRGDQRRAILAQEDGSRP